MNVQACNKSQQISECGTKWNASFTLFLHPHIQTSAMQQKFILIGLLFSVI